MPEIGATTKSWLSFFFNESSLLRLTSNSSLDARNISGENFLRIAAISSSEEAS